jgi:hypothetical protein
VFAAVIPQPVVIFVAHDAVLFYESVVSAVRLSAGRQLPDMRDSRQQKAGRLK